MRFKIKLFSRQINVNLLWTGSENGTHPLVASNEPVGGTMAAQLYSTIPYSTFLYGTWFAAASKTHHLFGLQGNFFL